MRSNIPALSSAGIALSILGWISSRCLRKVQAKDDVITIESRRLLAIATTPAALPVTSAAPVVNLPATSTASSPAVPTVPPTTPSVTSAVATATLPSPTSWNGNFLAHGEGLTTLFVQTVVQQSLKKMFRFEKSPVSVTVKRKITPSASARAKNGTSLLTFSCTFQVCTKAMFFDSAYLMSLMHNESMKVARFSHLANGKISVNNLTAADTHIPCQGAPETNVPISYGMLGHGACFAHHKVRLAATSKYECARACDFHPGCVVFSFGGKAGCRISACADPRAKRISQVNCGHAEDNTKTLRAQCATRPFVGSEVFYLIGLQVIGVNVGCDYKYIPFPTSRPLGCSEACKSDPHCNIFSFGRVFGCRLSACFDPLSVGGDMKCISGHGQHMGVAGQCITEARNGSYLYALTLPKIVQTTGGPPLPPQASGGGGGGGGGNSVSSSDSTSSASIGDWLGKVFRVLVAIGCVVIVVGLVWLCVKSLKESGKLKNLLNSCRKKPGSFTLDFYDEKLGEKITMSFTETPLNIAFWDTPPPLKVCSVHPDSEAKRKGVKEGWVVTSVSGRPLEGLDVLESVKLINSTALRCESTGGLRRHQDVKDGL